LKIGRNTFATVLLAILLASLVLPIMAYPVAAKSALTIVNEEKGWKKIETDLITVLFPADGRKPMFLWWYTKEPEKVYIVKFEGLIEYFTFPEQYFKRKYQAFPENLHGSFIKPKEGLLPGKIRGALTSIYKNWHSPYLPFNACNWTLTEPEPIIGDNGVIGYAFAFNLTRARIPRFKFVENNIMIRCRFYNTTVSESVDDLYKYTVTAGELKMDLVIKNWTWNIDLIKPLLSDLQEHGITIPQHNSGLALWINLASINATKIKEAEDKPEEIEGISTASYVMVEGNRVFVKPNKTDEDEKPITVKKGPHEHFKLQFATEDETLTGYFRFIASAKMTNITGTYTVPVKASYIEAGAHMRLFLSYPYFGNGTLEHDPSIGVDVPELATPKAATPKYEVESPSGTQIMPQVRSIVVPIVTPQSIAILLAVASTIAIAVFMLKRKGKYTNIIH
jgi:hypothetical protein